jgi:hypothetical protein
MDPVHFLLFASDAVLVALAGAALLVVALIAVLAERRRNRRKSIDAVGWVPWTAIFLFSCFGAAGLLALGVKGLLGG